MIYDQDISAIYGWVPLESGPRGLADVGGGALVLSGIPPVPVLLADGAMDFGMTTDERAKAMSKGNNGKISTQGLQMNGRCDICNRSRAHGNHERCARTRQEMYRAIREAEQAGS